MGRHGDSTARSTRAASEKRTASTVASTASLALALFALAGCATAEKTEPLHLVWPQPPETARIEFVRSLFSDEDLHHDTTFSQKLVNFLGGDKPTPNRIAEPLGLAVSDDGTRLYVADYAQMAVFVFDFAHDAFLKIGDKEPLARPVGIAVDAAGLIYVVEQANKTISVFDPTGKPVRTIGDASLERPSGIAIDRTRARIYVADSGHTKSKEHTVKIFATDGHLVGKIGGAKGSEPGHFLFPTYVAVDGAGNVYVTDTLNSRVQVFDADGHYVRKLGERGNAWGMFDKPKGVAIDTFGNVYVADAGWSNVQIFNQKGQVLLFFANRGIQPGMLRNPTAMAIDRKNRIYVADYLNHRVEVYQLVNTTAADSFAGAAAPTKGGAPTAPRQDASNDGVTK